MPIIQSIFMQGIHICHRLWRKSFNGQNPAVISQHYSSLKGCSTSNARTCEGACPLGPAASKMAYAAPSPTWPRKFRVWQMQPLAVWKTLRFWNLKCWKWSWCKNQNCSWLKHIQTVVFRCHAAKTCKDLGVTCQCHRKGWLKRRPFCCNDRQKWLTCEPTRLINRILHQLIWQIPQYVLCSLYPIWCRILSINKKRRKLNCFQNTSQRNKWHPGSLFGLYPVCLQNCIGIEMTLGIRLDFWILGFCFGSPTFHDVYHFHVLAPPKAANQGTFANGCLQIRQDLLHT